MKSVIQRAMSLVGSTWPYVLGGGNHNGPTQVRRKDGTLSPFGFDCWGFAHTYAFQIPRHRPGFNVGKWATVSDDINCDAAIEDSEHNRELFELVTGPARVGDLFVMPSIRGPDGKRIRIGHVWLVIGVPAEAPPVDSRIDYTTLQCSPKAPAIKRGPGPKTDARTYKGMTDDAWRIRALRVKGQIR